MAERSDSRSEPVFVTNSSLCLSDSKSEGTLVISHCALRFQTSSGRPQDLTADGAGSDGPTGQGIQRANQDRNAAARTVGLQAKPQKRTIVSRSVGAVCGGLGSAAGGGGS